MKKLFAISIFLFLLIISVSKVMATTFELVVIPSSIAETRENFYNFQNADEIFAQDIINSLNSSNKVHAQDLYQLNSILNLNPTLKTQLYSALKQYDTSKTIDYSTMRQLANKMNARSVLLISANAETSNGKIKRNTWELLNLSSVFDISQENNMKIDAVLLDNVNDLVMWSSVYKFKLTGDNSTFRAEDYSQAIEQLTKIKLFSKNILSKSIAQNVTLRFYPKSISTVDVKPVGKQMDSGFLKYNKNVPSITRFGKNREKTNNSDEEEFYGDLIFGL